MTVTFYETITAPYRRHPRLLQALKFTNHAITAFTFLAYSGLLLYLLLTRAETFWRAFLTPAVSFVVVDILRRAIPAQRPYEKLAITPLIPKKRKKRSFPSRHVYAIYVIAMTFFPVWLPLGIALCVLGVLMAYIRVVGGMHFPRDVLAGAAIGVLSGVIGLYLL